MLGELYTSYYCFIFACLKFICSDCKLIGYFILLFSYVDCYYVTVRDGDAVKHYRVRQLDEGSFFIARRVTFPTLANLVEHYSRDADGLCVNLKKPCSPVDRLMYCLVML